MKFPYDNNSVKDFAYNQNFKKSFKPNNNPTMFPPANNERNPN